MSKKQKKIIIIGAGISGLSAGIYALENGFKTVIYEKNSSVGGLCTGWYRKGQYIDGCIHWLTGTKKGEILYDMWKNVGAFSSDEQIIQPDIFASIKYENYEINFWCDFNKSQNEWISLFPEDESYIKKFFRYTKNISLMELPLHCPIKMMPLSLLLKTGFKIIPHIHTLLMTKFQTRESFASHFKSPALRFAFKNLQPGKNNLFSTIYAYSTVAIGNGGVPKGGSKPMVERMAQRFYNLGGDIKFNTQVKQVLIKHDIAKGIILSNGDIVESDYVVAACDALYSLGHLLDNKYLDKKFSLMKIDDSRYPIPSCVYLFFKTNKDISNIKVPTTFGTKPFKVGNSIFDCLNVRPYYYDPKTFSIDGNTCFSVILDQYEFDFSYWKEIYKNKELYNETKKEIAKEVILRIEKEYPHLKDSIELLDIFTPITLNRYVNAYAGAYMPFAFTSKGKMLFHNNQVKGLSRFYMASQWTQTPGGLPLALCSGKFVIQRICKKEKKFYMFDKSTFIIKN